MDIYKYILTEGIDDTDAKSLDVPPTTHAESTITGTTIRDFTANNSRTINTNLHSLFARIFPRTNKSEAVAPDIRTDEEPVTPQTEDPLCAVDVLPVTSPHTLEEASVDKVAPPPDMHDTPLPDTPPKSAPPRHNTLNTMDGVAHSTLPPTYAPDKERVTQLVNINNVPANVQPSAIQKTTSTEVPHATPQATSTSSPVTNVTGHTLLTTVTPSTPLNTCTDATAGIFSKKNMDGVANGITRKLDFRDERMVRLAETRVSVPPSQRTTAKKPSTGSYVVTLRPKQSDV